MSTSGEAAASTQPTQGPPREADDLRRQNAEDDEQDQPTTPPPSDVDSRYGRGCPRHLRPESDTSSRKSARSAWRKNDRLQKEKDEKR